MIYNTDMSRQVTAKPLDMIARGGRLRTAIKHRGYTIGMLANQTDISYSTISKFLAGERDMHLDDLTKISSALGVTTGWLGWGD